MWYVHLVSFRTDLTADCGWNNNNNNNNKQTFQNAKLTIKKWHSLASTMVAQSKQKL